MRAFDLFLREKGGKIDQRTLLVTRLASSHGMLHQELRCQGLDFIDWKHLQSGPGHLEGCGGCGKAGRLFQAPALANTRR